MTSIAQSLQKDGLNIAVQERSSDVFITWRGVSDTRDPGAVLNPFMQTLCGQLKGKRVTMDFHEFEYMNSATVAPIINFVRQLSSSEVPIKILYNKAVDWQRLNFQVLSVIATTMKNVLVQSV